MVVLAFPHKSRVVGAGSFECADHTPSAEGWDDDADAVRRVGALHRKAKLDIDALIVTCGIALMHGRRARDLISDPRGRRRLEVSIKAIEAMIELARMKAGQL